LLKAPIVAHKKELLHKRQLGTMIDIQSRDKDHLVVTAKI
jgi:hypothetical protein